MKLLRNILGFLLAALVIVVCAGLWATRRSLPPAHEARSVAGLDGPVTIAWDAAGVPTLRASTERDMAFAQGWAHARDRRFQMDLSRRNAAGRLAEVVGRGALPLDRQMRLYGFASLVEGAAPGIAPRRRAIFEAYAAGVNAWDHAHAAPPEYAVLGLAREPWRASDCSLMLLLMFSELNDAGEAERDIERMDATLPRALVDFLLPETTPFDVALEDSPMPAAPRTPRADEVNVHGEPVHEALVAPGGSRPEGHAPGGNGPGGHAAWAPARAASWFAAQEERLRGSNNWAVAPSRSASGHALFAGDPHLGLRVPVIWHRQRLEGAGLHVTGITLPGSPGVVMGTNGDVAWSMTNVEPDAADLVRAVPADADTASYLGPAGPEPFRIRTEVIHVKGAPPETLRVRLTRWGPVLGPSARPGGGLLALQWVALDPWMIDMDLYDLDHASSVADLIARLPLFRGPIQNFVSADREGHIGWAPGGWMPRRAGFDPRRPREGSDPRAGWYGYIGPDSLPHVVDPPGGVLVSANQRTCGGRAREVLGTGFAMPWRARRIQNALAARADWTAESMAALQNDVDDALLGPTAAALDRALTPEACAHDTTLAAVRRILSTWTHRADSTSVAHAFLRYARAALVDRLIKPLVAPCVAADSNFSYSWALTDEVARRLLDERPLHLLDPAYTDYDALARAAAKQGAADLMKRVPGVPLEKITWGRVNRSAIHHPLGDAVPMLGRWLNMPDAALAGGSGVVRVARPRGGASMRMAVDLGDPSRSRFALPGGQSGHFLSANYGDEFADWVAGRTAPLEPGSARDSTRLIPARPR